MRTYEGMVRRLIHTIASVTITEEIALVSCLGSGPYDVTLPTAQDAAGLIFVIRCDDNTIAGNVRAVAEAGDGANIYIDDAAAAANLTMTAIDDYTILYSDGNNWYQLAGVQT